MDTIFEDLIADMEKQIAENEAKIVEIKKTKDDTLLFLYIGKIIAFESCIKELRKDFDYKTNKNRKQVS